MAEKLEEKPKKICELPKALTFKGIRELVLERVWKRAEEAEKRGIPLTHEDFGKFLKEEWERVKTEIPKLTHEYQECLKASGLMESVDKLIETEKEELKKLGVKEQE